MERPKFDKVNDLGGVPILTAGLSHEQMEDKCRRCGISCHANISVGGRNVMIEGMHCKYLAKDEDGVWGCTTYPTRIETAPWCGTLQEGLERGAMATDCPYGEGAESFFGKTKLTREEYIEKWPEILHEMRQQAWEHWWNFEDAAKEIGRLTPGIEWRFEPAEEHPGFYWLEYSYAKPST